MMMIKKIKPDNKLWDGKTASGFEVPNIKTDIEIIMINLYIQIIF